MSYLYTKMCLFSYVYIYTILCGLVLFPGTSAVLLVVTWNTLQQKIGIPHLLLLRYLPVHNWNRCSNWMLLKCTRCQTSTALHILKGRFLKAYWIWYIYIYIRGMLLAGCLVTSKSWMHTRFSNFDLILQGNYIIATSLDKCSGWHIYMYVTLPPF